MLDFDLLDLEQGSDEWHSWRASGIGASEASSIMGENRWKSRRQLFDQKLDAYLGFSDGRGLENMAMAEGTRLEPIARQAYIEQTGIAVEPICIQSRRYPWMLASLDGLCIESKTVIEIKCGNSAYRYTSQSGRVPDYYYAQLQHILAICEFEGIDFWCFIQKKTPILISVPRNQSYIEDLVDREVIFWRQIKGDYPRER